MPAHDSSCLLVATCQRRDFSEPKFIRKWRRCQLLTTRLASDLVRQSWQGEVCKCIQSSSQLRPRAPPLGTDHARPVSKCRQAAASVARQPPCHSARWTISAHRHILPITLGRACPVLQQPGCNSQLQPMCSVTRKVPGACSAALHDCNKLGSHRITCLHAQQTSTKPR